jgi:hypothetical protein
MGNDTKKEKEKIEFPFWNLHASVTQLSLSLQNNSNQPDQ